MRLFSKVMDVITSTRNGTVKLFRSLSDKKFRKSEGLFPVEGGNILKDIPSSADVRFVLATPEREEEARARFAGSGTQVFVVSDDVMKSVSDTVTPYGLAAAVGLPKKGFSAPQGNALLLDGVSDPGNLGTLLRTAAATGFGDVYLLGCTDAYAPKAVRASMGGIFRARVFEASEEEALSLVRATNSYALDMAGEDIFSVPLSTPCILVAGSEAHGVRESLLSACAGVRALPMTDGMESLNVAVAASVAMYAAIHFH